MEGERGSVFLGKWTISSLESGRFLPIMIGEGGLYFGKDDLFFLLHNYLPDKVVVRSAFLFYQRRGGRFMGEPTLIT